MRFAFLLSLLLVTSAHAEIPMSRALALSCLNHFKKNLTKEAVAFCSCYPERVLTKDNVKAIEEAQGLMNQEIRTILDEAGDTCLMGRSEPFRIRARNWIENEK